jgi:hypothetical protein
MIRVRGTFRESERVESPPHPDPLPASGEREKNYSHRFLRLKLFRFLKLLRWSPAPPR